MRLLVNMVKALFAIDDKTFQKVRCKFFGKTQDLNVLNMYGISINPPDNSFGVAFWPNGYGDDGFATIDRPDLRFTGLEKGELKIGNYLTGDYVHFKADGTIEVKATTKVDVVAPTVNITSSVEVNIVSPLVNISGDAVVVGDVTANNFITGTVADYNIHVHSGVTSGTGTSGGPS